MRPSFISQQAQILPASQRAEQLGSGNEQLLRRLHSLPTLMEVCLAWQLEENCLSFMHQLAARIPKDQSGDLLRAFVTSICGLLVTVLLEPASAQARQGDRIAPLPPGHCSPARARAEPSVKLGAGLSFARVRTRSGCAISLVCMQIGDLAESSSSGQKPPGARSALNGLNRPEAKRSS